MKYAIHAKHRPKVSEENKPAFGKLIGAAQIFCGAGIIVFGLMSILAVISAKPLFMTVGLRLMAAGLTAAVGIFFLANMKYNKET